MKIPVEAGQDKPLLPDGQHTVEITDIQEGTSEHQNVPFFAARMENEDGFVTQRFYTSEKAMPILLSLYAAVGIQPEAGKDLDTKQLLGKKLSVEVGEHHYDSPATGNDRTIKQAGNFQAL
jgi:hypothetical protein